MHTVLNVCIYIAFGRKVFLPPPSAQFGLVFFFGHAFKKRRPLSILFSLNKRYFFHLKKITLNDVSEMGKLPTFLLTERECFLEGSDV